MIVLKVNKNVYDPLRLSEWKQGFMWSYNLSINMVHLEDQQLAWFLKQSVEYGGTAMAQQMTTTDLNTLMHWRYNNGLPLNKPAKTIERLRGSTALIQWLIENNQATMKRLEESRQQWTADTTGAQDGQLEDQQDIDENM